jgi:hypothetical protein
VLVAEDRADVAVDVVGVVEVEEAHGVAVAGPARAARRAASAPRARVTSRAAAGGESALLPRPRCDPRSCGSRSWSPSPGSAFRGFWAPLVPARPEGTLPRGDPRVYSDIRPRASGPHSQGRSREAATLEIRNSRAPRWFGVPYAGCTPSRAGRAVSSPMRRAFVIPLFLCALSRRSPCLPSRRRSRR